MEGEHTLIVIRVILAMNHASIQLKYSLEIPLYSNISLIAAVNFEVVVVEPSITAIVMLL